MMVRKRLVEVARSGVMGLLAPLERRELAKAQNALPPVCFILGPPRSGTTLLYELMITRYRFAYFSNLAHRFYRTPVSVARLGRRRTESWRGSFESAYGHIDGWGAPNEGGWIWNRWFPEATYLDEKAANGLPVAEIRATVAGTSAALGDSPFLNKNVMHSVHMRLLDALFPGCLFISLDRDPAANMRSILRARAAERSPASTDWWSVKPVQWARYRDDDEIMQAAAQVHCIRRDIDRDAEHLGADRHLSVDYADLCSDPRSSIDAIGAFLRRAGCLLKEREELPESFSKDVPTCFEPATESAIRAALDHVQPDSPSRRNG